ncbi:hypothetical protein LQE88_09960 [Acidaminococcus sp. NSJ-142]|jgi:hypothetical protein|uniref:hypothetical protein n=1 Tax=Acidaminococcus hominis TaxID=2897706 RepID=UPI001E580A83|nr:hypothetical protein [Acidaminococcus hominis]MCD2436302.1 hypothetical protein [Acidaminococcus hominis]
MDQEEAKFYAVGLVTIGNELLVGHKIRNMIASVLSDTEQNGDIADILFESMLHVNMAMIDYICCEKYGESEERNMIFEDYIKILANPLKDGHSERFKQFMDIADESIENYGVLFREYGAREGIEQCGIEIFTNIKINAALYLNIMLTKQQYFSFRDNVYLPTMTDLYKLLTKVLNINYEEAKGILAYQSSNR